MVHVVAIALERRAHRQLADVQERPVERSQLRRQLADGSKLGVTAFAQICELGRVTELITDTDAPGDVVDELTAQGIAVTAV